MKKPVLLITFVCIASSAWAEAVSSHGDMGLESKKTLLLGMVIGLVLGFILGFMIAFTIYDRRRQKKELKDTLKFKASTA